MLDTILLAGGYATRLYPLTLDRPKALLPVGSKVILDHIVDALERSEQIGRLFLITNDKFARQLGHWAAGRTWERPIQILNDGTNSNRNRLGAIGDIRFALDNSDISTEQGVFVVGTDNLAQFDITEVVRQSEQRRASAVFAVRMSDAARLMRMGVVLLGEDDRVLEFEEKPTSPKSDRGVPPFYAYGPEAVLLLREYLDGGGNPDAPGHFIEWLVHKTPVYACRTDEMVFDMGTPESYEATRQWYEGRR